MTASGNKRPIQFVAGRKQQAIRLYPSHDLARARRDYLASLLREKAAAVNWPAALTAGLVNATAIAVLAWAPAAATGRHSAGDQTTAYPVSLLPPTVQEETESEIETDVEEIAEQVPREILSQDEPPPAAPSPLAAAVPQPREVRAADQAYQPPPQPLSARSCACSTGGQALTPNYWDSVRNRIAACMRYPASARREGKDGVVVVRVEVDSEGGLVAATPLQEPGEPSLARAVVAGVRRAAPFGSPFGPDGKATNSVAASIVIRFELIQGVERARQESGNQPERRQG